MIRRCPGGTEGLEQSPSAPEARTSGWWTRAAPLLQALWTLNAAAPNGLQRPPATPPLAPATTHGRVHKPAVGRRPSSQPNPEPAQAPTGRGQPVHAHPGPLAPKEPPRGSGRGSGSGRALRGPRAEPRLSRRPHTRSQGGVERAPSPGLQRVSAGTEEAAPPLPRPGLVPPHGQLRTTLRPRGDLPARREGRAGAAPADGNRVRPRLRSVSPEAAPSGLPAPPAARDPGPRARQGLAVLPGWAGAPAAPAVRAARKILGLLTRVFPARTCGAASRLRPAGSGRGRAWLPPEAAQQPHRPRARQLHSRGCGTEVAGGAREGAGAAADGHEAGRVPDAPSAPPGARGHTAAGARAEPRTTAAHTPAGPRTAAPRGRPTPAPGRAALPPAGRDVTPRNRGSDARPLPGGPSTENKETRIVRQRRRQTRDCSRANRAVGAAALQRLSRRLPRPPRDHSPSPHAAFRLQVRVALGLSRGAPPTRPAPGAPVPPPSYARPIRRRAPFEPRPTPLPSAHPSPRCNRGPAHSRLFPRSPSRSRPRPQPIPRGPAFNPAPAPSPAYPAPRSSPASGIPSLCRAPPAYPAPRRFGARL
ncbi:basic proline-rich protein-like [Lontra canadensis]|uniref:basic proline-rich protein-like n=1 Tax=Lontra canadensis TaxID=76717 RepID=UPI0013F37255|nr:basic proline-rich protein-like [Lontra canadensis]